MSILGSLSVKLGIRNKIMAINLGILIAVISASGFTIIELMDLEEEVIQNVILIQAILIAAVVGVHGYMFFFGNSVATPIVDAVNITKKISNGDLNVTIEKSNSNDELGELTNSLDSMTKTLRNLVNEVRNTATKVASDSRDSAAATEQLNSSVEEVSSTVQQIATGSQSQASELAEAKSIVDGVMDTNSSGSTAAEKMSRIIELTNESSEKIKSLAEKSAKITSVVEVIRSIAEKTNLLALNAAIEAARAGESGRGFAVVADEVRRLAEGSTKSSEEIDELLRQIQDDINTTVQSIDDSAAEIEEGRKVVDSSLKALSRIGNKVQEVAAVAEQNAFATDQAYAAVEQQTSATQEISSSSQNIARLAEELEKKVSFFVIPSKDSEPSKKDENQKNESTKTHDRNLSKFKGAKQDKIFESEFDEATKSALAKEKEIGS